MAEHDLFMGGNRTRTTFPQSMFPQADVLPDQTFEADNRRGPIDFSITRRFVWKCHEAINKGCPDDAFSDGLAQYFECNTFEDGDIINSHILPRFSSLREVWINVVTPSAGLVVDLQVRGNATSVGGVQTVASGIDFGTAGSQLITLDEPIYFDQNDMLQIVLVEGVDAAELECSEIMVSPVVREYCRGFN